jgi:hypothetical protein
MSKERAEYKDEQQLFKELPQGAKLVVSSFARMLEQVGEPDPVLSDLAETWKAEGGATSVPEKS